MATSRSSLRVTPRHQLGERVQPERVPHIHRHRAVPTLDTESHVRKLFRLNLFKTGITCMCRVWRRIYSTLERLKSWLCFVKHMFYHSLPTQEIWDSKERTKILLIP